MLEHSEIRIMPYEFTSDSSDSDFNELFTGHDEATSWAVLLLGQVEARTTVLNS